MKPLAVDLCCGLGGWTSGLLTEGWDVVGFDIERHIYGDQKYPAQLVLQDILTLDGHQFRGKVSLITASPPCQFFSYCAMPWSRAKDLAAKVQADAALLEQELALFNACVRIGKEADCPIIIENVRGTQPWVGRARWNYGSFYLWGDVPAPDAGHVQGHKTGRRLVRRSTQGRQGRHVSWFWFKISAAQDGERHDREDTAAAQPLYRSDISAEINVAKDSRMMILLGNPGFARRRHELERRTRCTPPSIGRINEQSRLWLRRLADAPCLRSSPEAAE